MYAASAVLSWYPSFYQKTNYYCTVAVSQSIAYFDPEEGWCYDLGSGSIARRAEQGSTTDSHADVAAETTKGGDRRYGEFLTGHEAKRMCSLSFSSPATAVGIDRSPKKQSGCTCPEQRTGH